MRDLVITYGGTVEAIDEVRVLTNLSRGGLGRMVVRAALEVGARVHVLHGRFAVPPTPCPGMTVEEFRGAIDLGERLERALGACDGPPGLAMIAAVSDYRPRETYDGKHRSDAETMTLELVRTPKLLDRVATWRPGTRVVSFKLAGRGCDDQVLYERAEAQRVRTGSVAVVANRFPGLRHTALWVSQAGSEELDSREVIAARVVAALALCA